MRKVAQPSSVRLEKEIETIRRMLDRTRRESADSSRFFIWMGVLAIVAVAFIDRLEALGRKDLVIPALLVVFAASGATGYMLVGRMGRIRSWTRSICIGVWIACGVPGLLVVFLFPAIGVYRWGLAPVLAAMLAGTAVFSTGVITESIFLTWSSLAWWVGGVAMSILEGTPRSLVMILVILFGWILPGVTMRHRYGSKRTQDGS